jgi:CubicO group peptidase (beta-lactamase class C family)
MLGYALGRAAGIPFMELVDGALIRPLGMASTGFVVTPGMAEFLATGYLVDESGSVDPEVPYREHIGRGYKIPNGGIYSTVGDLGRFIAGLTGSATVPILGAESRGLIRTPQTPADSDTQYSFGFFLYGEEGAPELVGHSGSVAGYNAFLAFEPDSGVGVILLRNYGGGETNLGRASRDLLRRLLESM